MDKTIEERFIKKFITKRAQSRLQFELFPKNRRLDGIDRFSHNTEGVIENNRICKKNFKFEHSLEIINEVTCENFYKQCYVISSNVEADGNFFNINEAIYLCNAFYGPSIIIISENVVLIKAEQVKGAAENFLLIKSN